MSERRGIREGVNDADATGMVAGEELITQAETMLPLVRSPLPREQLHAALPHGHAAHATIDDLHAQVEGEAPDASAIHRHITALRGLPELEAIVANWWDDPKTQRFFETLGQIGL
jgi:hypothetical protein